jgi:hypothetical protein
VPPEHAERLASLFPDHERIELDADTHLIWLGPTATEVWEKRLRFLRQGRDPRR